MGKDKYNIFDGKGSNGWTFAKAIETDPLRKFAIAVAEVKAGFKPSQMRGKDGKWTDGGAGSDPKTPKKWDEKNSTKKVLDNYNAYGGSSHLIDGTDMGYTDGMSAVSTRLSDTVKFKGRTLDASILNAYIRAKREVLQSTKYRNAIGTWFNEKDGYTYLDISRIVPTETAMALAKEFNQIAYFDLELMEDVKTGGTGKKEKRDYKAAYSRRGKFVTDGKPAKEMTIKEILAM